LRPMDSTSRDFGLSGQAAVPITIETVGRLAPAGIRGVSMQTFTLTAGSWLRRLLARNALVRTSDRIEAIAMVTAVLFAVVAVPVAGALGTAVYDNRVRALAGERLIRHEVEAAATHDSWQTWLPYQTSTSTPVQWQFAGRTHSDILSTPEKMKNGDHTSIWVNAAGERTVPPLSDNDAAAEAAMLALGLWTAVAGVGAAACALLRIRLNHVRFADWDRELSCLAGNDGQTNRNV
jgi:hypothetical protein